MRIREFARGFGNSTCHEGRRGPSCYSSFAGALPPPTLTFSHSLSLSLTHSLARARALSLSLSLALSLSRVLSPSSDLRSAFRSPSGGAIVFLQRSSLTSSSSSASEINQASSCRHRRARNPLKQRTSKDFFGITRKWMIHRPIPQGNGGGPTDKVTDFRALSAQISLRSPLCCCAHAVCDPNSAQTRFQV